MNLCKTLMQQIRDWFSSFVSAPASPSPLAVFRIGLALVLLTQAVVLSGHLLALYGPHGIVQWSYSDDLITTGVPKLSWLADLVAPLGISGATCTQVVFAVYLLSLAGLLLGWRTRWSAAVAWLAHLAISNAGVLSLYGVDMFAHIMLFYCVWMPVGDDWSLDRSAGRTKGKPSATARLSLRVLQIHVAIAYLATGLDKASGTQWWTGEAIWRSTMRPDVAQLDMTWMANFPWLAMLACWGTLLVEIGYPLFVGIRWTRKPWVLMTMGLHLGIAISMGLYYFSALMIVLNVTAFLIPREPAKPAVGPKPDRQSHWTNLRFRWSLEKGWQLREEKVPMGV